VVFTLAPESSKGSRAGEEGALVLSGGGGATGTSASEALLGDSKARGTSGQARVVVGGGPAAYRALLQAEFEEKSERVLAVLQAKDATVAKLEAELRESQAREAQQQEELEETRGKLAAATLQCDELNAELHAFKAPSLSASPSTGASLAPPPATNAAKAQGEGGARSSPYVADASSSSSSSEQIETLVAEVARLQAELAAANRREAQARADADELVRLQPSPSYFQGGGMEHQSSSDLLQRRVDGEFGYMCVRCAINCVCESEEVMNRVSAWCKIVQKEGQSRRQIALRGRILAHLCCVISFLTYYILYSANPSKIHSCCCVLST